jgi:threonine dehydrogenase-like Zn-dependent dehydrogenase
MLAAQYTQGVGFAVRQTQAPQVADDELLVRVEAASICGTDVKIIRHGHRKLREGQTITLGHEFVGTIEKVGARVRGCREGQRVGVAPNIGCGRCAMCARELGNMCPDYSAFGIDRDGAHASHVQVPAAAIAQGLVIPLPEGLTAAQAALAEPLSCVVNAHSTTRIAEGDFVLVYGAGPMGLLNVMLAANGGAARVAAVDLSDERLAKARQVGARDAINSASSNLVEWVRDQTGGRGVDVAIIAAAVPSLQQEALALLAPFGRLCLFAGWPKGAGAVPLDTSPVHYKNLVVTGSTGGSAADYQAALELIASGRIDVSQIVSHIFSLQQLQEAYDVALSGKGMKVLLTA